MPGQLRIAMAQFDFPVGAVADNTERIGALIAQARDEFSADVVVFPELALCGYPPEDLLLRPAFLEACARDIEALAKQVRGIVAVVGWPEAAGAVVYNAVSVLRDSCIETTYRKRELPNYAVFDERRHFAVDPDGGSCIVEVCGVSVGVLICEDLWFAEPLAETAADGAELVLVPNASPFEHGKAAQRDALIARRVAETGMALAYLNAVGGQDELVFDGGSVLADGDGHVHAAARAFDDRWLVADFEPATRRFTPVQWDAETDESRGSLAWRALVRGTRDYVRKNGFSGVLLGLSGGVDSAMVLAIAVDALGPENVTAVRLPSRYTSDLSNDLADAQAKALGVTLHTVPIEAPFTGFLDALAPLFDGMAPDVTEENLQSRCRGAIMMALSNKFGGLLLTTGNKSEYAVGYATIYGDMCGGYAPIKDVYKTDVFALCRWRNAQGDGERIPDAVIARPPSAELRENQLDQDSLPPYDLLDAILERHIEGGQSSGELISAGFDPTTVQRLLRLVRLNEWKRRQAAPGPKVSPLAFGRERRYPITSGFAG
ncbi:NAD+ synthase [Xanthomonadaceae bacterium JHOS43]|nr:NAD+ synthase [Xanthomonadaceae bacterium JHOS43]MCX7564428.1 NAD+ synthase [Xanthomonadaceae bacterium XH05]